MREEAAENKMGEAAEEKALPVCAPGDKNSSKNIIAPARRGSNDNQRATQRRYVGMR
jgi:hypothetical protein